MTPRIVVIGDAWWYPRVLRVARRLEHWGTVCRTSLRWGSP